VLTVTMPVAEQVKPPKVEITSGGGTKEFETSSAGA